MQAILSFINNVLNPVGIVVGLILAVPVFWTWWQVVFGERRRQRRWLAEVMRQPGSRPGILVIDSLPGRSIMASVRKHVANCDGLRDIPNERFFSVSRDEALKPGALIDFSKSVRAAARALLDAGCDVIHLFHGGPDVSALIVGAEFSNGPRVLLYHHEQGGYVLFGPLEPLRFNN